MKEEIRAHYDRFAQTYDEKRERRQHFYLLQTRQIVKLVGKCCGNLKGKRILEAGCGTGRVLAKLKEQGAIVRGIDLSEEMVKRCRAKGVRAETGDATNLPFKDNEFDCVISFLVLSHVPDIEKALREMKRVSGGKVIFQVNNKYSPTNLLNQLVLRWFAPSRVYTKTYSGGEAMRAAEKSGIRAAKCYGLSIVPFPRLILGRRTAGIAEWLEDRLSGGFLGRFFAHIVIAGE